jgi:hypothetical protein
LKFDASNRLDDVLQIAAKLFSNTDSNSKKTKPSKPSSLSTGQTTPGAVKGMGSNGSARPEPPKPVKPIGSNGSAQPEPGLCDF